MKVPLSWLHEMLPSRPSAREAAEALTRVGIEVAGIRQLAEGFENVVVARIRAPRPHPNADRLTLCEVEDGAAAYSVVCGARNMKAGDRVALAKAGAVLPGGAAIKKSRLRGEISEGMLCSGSELKLSEESEGILIFPEDAPLGAPLAEYLGREESVLDLEITPNRGDALSVIGVARELAAALKAAVKIPLAEGEGPKEGTVKARVEDPEGAPRYVLRLVEGVSVRPSPPRVRNRLEACGLRSLNSVVDAANYVMLEWGQPLHAFDAEKVAGTISVRRAKTGEAILCLDGIDRALSAQDLVIADEKGPVAVAGVIGGARAAVGPETKAVLLESAHFEPKSVRRTARRLSLHTESSHRFERFVDPAGVWAAAGRAVELLSEHSGGRESGAVDLKSRTAKSRPVVLKSKTVARVLGESPAGAGESLARLGLTVEKHEEGWKVEIPPRRHDLQREIDLVEEIARLHGYDRFSSLLPPLSGEPVGESVFERIDVLKTVLRSAGLREVRGGSFVSRADQARFASASLGDPLEISNPLTTEEPLMRQSLYPSLLSAWKVSASRQAAGARLFEIGRVFGAGPSREGTPAKEETRLAVLFAGTMDGRSWHGKERSADFYDARGILEFVSAQMEWGDVAFRRADGGAVFHPGQAAEILWQGRVLGSAGTLNPRLNRELDLGAAAMAEICLDPLLGLPSSGKQYEAISPFPVVRRDLAFVVPREKEAERIPREIASLGERLLRDLVLFDLYEGKGIPAGQKNLAFRATFGLPDRTLTDAEVDAALGRIVRHVEATLGAKLRV